MTASTPRSLALLAVMLLAPAMPASAGRAQQAAPPCDVLIAGGTVVDGTGADRYRADVAVRDGRVVAVGDLRDFAARRTLDATGKIVVPGFIDAHTHSENIKSRPEARNFLMMGVTTLISGNCGGSERHLDAVFAQLERTGISANYASLVGHSTVRRAVLGNARRAPSAAELDSMRQLTRDAMEAGAVGLSTGLIYVPGTYATTDELIALAKVAAEYGGVYATHMRDEGDGVLDAIEEALRIGREAGIRAHLSHLKASGKSNWGRSAEIVQRLRAARAAGLQVTGDQYAYTASSTSLDVLFPSAALEVGRKAFAAELTGDAAFAGRMQQALLRVMKRSGFGDLSYATIASAPQDRELAGLTLADLAERRLGDRSPEHQARATCELYATSKGRRIGMIYHKMCEDDVERLMREPYIAVACDAGIRSARSANKPHPRGAGNNPRVLAHYVRERHTLTLELAIHKMTALPAAVFGLRDRGVVRPGAWADLVVFDPDEIVDRATYDEPNLPPAGIDAVLVCGTIVVERGHHLGLRPGMVLRHLRRPAPRVGENH